MGSFPGMGPSPVAIPASMFAHKADRIEVSLTAAEVRDALARQKPQEHASGLAGYTDALSRMKPGDRCMIAGLHVSKRVVTG